jgi:hypothetical protein
MVLSHPSVVETSGCVVDCCLEARCFEKSLNFEGAIRVRAAGKEPGVLRSEGHVDSAYTMGVASNSSNNLRWLLDVDVRRMVVVVNVELL